MIAQGEPCGPMGLLDPALLCRRCLCLGKGSTSWSLDQTLVAPSVPLPEPKNPHGATAMLAKFRPIRSTPEDLQRLLEAKADQNMTVGEGSISPMENIMTFAREVHVPHEIA